jgi:mono/diheme cytochrome c family protein
LGVGIFVAVEASAFDASMSKVYEVSAPPIHHSADPSAIARGKHIAESLGGCSGNDCHGADLAGGKTVDMGPIGRITGPNLTPRGAGGVYRDEELARVVRHGVKKDGHSLRFMPAQDLAWLPDSDLVALISYLRSVPPVDKPNGPVKLGVLAKVLDRRDMIIIDVARRIDHSARKAAPTQAPTADYGALLARSCTGCHGKNLSGGAIPGAPSELPIPANLTPHETGLKDWSYADFDRLLATGVKKDGKKLDPFMPYESLGKLDPVEKQALWAYLRSLPPRPFGQH